MARRPAADAVVAAAQPVRDCGDLAAAAAVKRRDQRHAPVEQRRHLAAQHGRRDRDVGDRDQMSGSAEPQRRRRPLAQEHERRRDGRQRDETDREVHPVRLPHGSCQHDQARPDRDARRRAPSPEDAPVRSSGDRCAHAGADGCERMPAHHAAAQPSCVTTARPTTKASSTGRISPLGTRPPIAPLPAGTRRTGRAGRSPNVCRQAGRWAADTTAPGARRDRRRRA